MKIKKLQVHMMSAPLKEPFFYSQGWVNERNSVIVEVETHEGLCGFGECLCHGTMTPQMAAAFIENCYRPRVIGRNIYDVEVIWEDLYNFSRPIGQFGLSVNALSGIDIAIWDVIG